MTQSEIRHKMVNSQFLAFGVNVAAMVALVAVYEYTLDWRNRKSLWTLIRPSKVRTRIAVLLSGKIDLGSFL